MSAEPVAEIPTTASILSIIGGVLLIFGGLYERSNIGTFFVSIGSTTYIFSQQDRTTLGGFGVIFGAVMIASGFMLRSHPEEHAPWGVVVIILSFLSIFTSLGGLIIGIILGVLGGISAIRWRPQTTILELDSEIWKSYEGDVVKDVRTIPGESDRVTATYEKSGLDGVVNYLRQKDPGLTDPQAIAVATGILTEIDFRRRQNQARQKRLLAGDPTV